MRNETFWRRTAPLIFIGLVLLAYPVVRLAIERFQIALEAARAFSSLGQGLSLGIYHAGPDEEILSVVQRVERWGVDNLKIVSCYQAWGLKEDNRFPARRLEGLCFDGRFPMITWEPWLVDWPLPEGYAWNQRPLRFIAGGGCDDYVRRWAADARDFKRVVLLRYAHEMNNPYYPWGQGHGDDPQTYQEAWRRLRRIFKEEGADNVLWVWSPYRTEFEDYFPGAREVDWIGYTLLNYGQVCPDSAWRGFRELMEPGYRALSGLNRPILLTEFGSQAAGGDPAQWAREALKDIPTRYPNIRAVVFFHSNQDQNWIFPSPPYAGVPWPLDWTGSLEALRR